MEEPTVILKGRHSEKMMVPCLEMMTVPCLEMMMANLRALHWDL